ncbi:ribonuclease P protein subunit p25-like protein [Nematolebias whitei]|uniref:ribonuclease P protein subunit p25-like protein n=1 Tax=Nematolebias whitei TaxID=451745 RepID=UPI00189AC7C9|nr:ribonuclease P protein subunit p25-like protein [Nematolebias whitei]XP_037532613.1 ribonuclease P protein subunit p25-like protein [Nematolebias whitei]
MENYSKARVVEQPSVCPFSGLASDTPEVRVKDGSKIRNLLRFALNRMEANPRRETEEGGRPEGGQQEAPGRPLCKQIIFTATGKGVSKAITCAEVVKRRVKGLHQVTKLTYGTVQEVWEPLEPAGGLDSLTVSRNLPSIWILLSREPLDGDQPGYQAPGRYDALWAQAASREEGGGFMGPRAGPRRKRGGGGGGGGGRGKGPSRQPGRPRESTKGYS